jgi:hypothetical protein
LKTTPKRKDSTEDKESTTPEKTEEEVPKKMPKVETHRKSQPLKPAIKKNIPLPVIEKIAIEVTS